MASADAKSAGTEAEMRAARTLGGERVGADAWFDVEDNNGEIWEVKSAKKRLKSGRRGRFRVIREQHINLRDHDGTYRFNLRGEDSHWRNVDPEEVDKMMEERDLSWQSAGKDPRGDHVKLPAAAVFPEAFDDD